MKTADRLSQRLGANIGESMGAGRDSTTADTQSTVRIPPANEVKKLLGVTRARGAFSIPVDKLVPDPTQPRREFDAGELERLAQSLASHGQLQPIRVRWDDDSERWVIISGERRFRAAQLAGLKQLDCVEARNREAPEDLLEDQLVENCLRQDLTPIEQANAFKRLLDARNWSYRQLAQRLSISHQQIVRALRLLDLPTEIQDQIEEGNLAPSVAYEIVRNAAPEARVALAEQVISAGLTREQVTQSIGASKSRAKNSAQKSKKSGERLPNQRSFRKAGFVIEVTHAKGIRAEALAATLRAIADELEIASRVA